MIYAKMMTNYIWIQCDNIVDDNTIERERAYSTLNTTASHRQVIMLVCDSIQFSRRKTIPVLVAWNEKRIEKKEQNSWENVEILDDWIFFYVVVTCHEIATKPFSHRQSL